jgi:peptide chain release factor subunit 1
MFSEKDLRELVEYQAQQSMLTIYLNTDPTLGNSDSYRLRLRNMLKTVELAADVQQVEEYFETEYDWSGKSVAIFSDQQNDFFRVFPIAVPVPDLVHVGLRPNVRPLAGLLDSYGGYGIVLMDKQGARLFHFHLGQIMEQVGYFGDAVKQVKNGGGSGVTGMRGGIASQTRSVDEVVERNMREIIDFSVRFFEEKHIRRIVLSGTDDNIALFRNYLPKMWQSLIVGTFPASMTDSHQEILAKTFEVCIKAEKDREHHLIDRLITQASKQSNAIVGLEPTLIAVNEARVQTLVIRPGFSISGFRCPQCNILTSHSDILCKQCNSETVQITDVISSAVSLTMKNGGDVDMVKENSAFEKAGNIGAFLRY